MPVIYSIAENGSDCSPTLCDMRAGEIHSGLEFAEESKAFSLKITTPHPSPAGLRQISPAGQDSSIDGTKQTAFSPGSDIRFFRWLTLRWHYRIGRICLSMRTRA